MKWVNISEFLVMSLGQSVELGIISLCTLCIHHYYFYNFKFNFTFLL